MDTEIIDRIYESSLVPERWPGVLEELGRLAEATGGSLFISKGDVLFWTASPSSRERADRAVKEGWYWRGGVTARLFAAHHAGFLADADVFSPEELDREPLYRDFLRPQGIGWTVGTVLPLPTGEGVNIAFTRRTERGPFEHKFVQRLDNLRPHLARTVLLSARLQLEHAQTVSETLAAIGLPALIVNERGIVLAANTLVESVSGSIQWRAMDRISLTDRAASRLLHDSIAAIGAACGGVRSFPVRNAQSEAMMVAHVVPIRLSARDIFVRSAAAVVLTPVAMPQAPPVELVQSLFDLTPAEARVARSLASGKSVEDIAADGGISPNTIRTHVRGVLEKTGCSRQTDVVALLTAISPLRLASPV